MDAVPEIRLVPRPQTPEAREVLGFDPSEGYEGCCKYGGDPEWIQEPFRWECCGEPMTFYAQIDGLEPPFELADSGMIYVFVCFTCYEVQAAMQCC